MGRSLRRRRAVASSPGARLDAGASTPRRRRGALNAATDREDRNSLAALDDDSETARSAGRLDARERFELVLGGHVFFQIMRTAVALDLFTILSSDPGQSMEVLAARTGVAPKPMRILLLGCAALQLIERRDRLYYNTSIAESQLNRGSRTNIVASVEFAHGLVYRPMFHLTDAVRRNANVGLSELPGEGETLYDRLSGASDLERVFHNGLQATSTQRLDQLLEQVDFSRFRHVLDVGGGNGTTLCTLVARHPELRGTLVDKPTVCSLAQERIAAEGLSGRIRTHSADCLTDPLPQGADCVLFMHFLTIWSEEVNLRLLRKSYQALPPGGSVVVFDGAQHDDETGPLRAARWSPYFLVLSSGEGMFYRAAEYREWIRQAGFEGIQQRQVAADQVLLVGTRP